MKVSHSIVIDGTRHEVTEVLGYSQEHRSRAMVVQTPEGERVAVKDANHKWVFAKTLIRPASHVCGQKGIL